MSIRPPVDRKSQALFKWRFILLGAVAVILTGVQAFRNENIQSEIRHRLGDIHKQISGAKAARLNVSAALEGGDTVKLAIEIRNDGNLNAATEISASMIVNDSIVSRVNKVMVVEPASHQFLRIQIPEEIYAKIDSRQAQFEFSLIVTYQDELSRNRKTYRGIYNRDGNYFDVVLTNSEQTIMRQ
ncbi:MAG: hypothetical protein HY587_05420 [Candidatus Omnitrophica bacterium]|nr:hypothetical protein [Candidatus Omnitrophota bacterium]